MYRALFLDFDGTLVNSLGMMRAIYERFLAGFGISGTDAEFNALNGPPLPRIVEILKQTHDLPGMEAQLLSRYESLIDDAYETAPPMPGARELLDYAQQRGMTTGIVTSGKSVWVRAWLKRYGWEDRIGFIVDRNDTAQGKPAPDPYLEALRQAKIEATRAVAIEDSAAGIEAATAAGVRTFPVGSATCPDLFTVLETLKEETGGYQTA